MGVENGALGQAPPARPGFCACFSQSVVPTTTPLSSPAKPPPGAEHGAQAGDVAASRNNAPLVPPAPARQPAPAHSASGRPGAPPLCAEDACLRWAVNSARWDPETNGEEWLFLLDLLPEEEQRQVCLNRCRHPALSQPPGAAESTVARRCPCEHWSAARACLLRPQRACAVALHSRPARASHAAAVVLPGPRATRGLAVQPHSHPAPVGLDHSTACCVRSPWPPQQCGARRWSSSASRMTRSARC